VFWCGVGPVELNDSVAEVIAAGDDDDCEFQFVVVCRSDTLEESVASKLGKVDLEEFA
jgi:hypothetical protein